MSKSGVMGDNVVDGVEKIDLNKGEKASKMKKNKQAAAAATAEKGGVKEQNPRPKYIDDRLVLWDKLKAEADAELAAKEGKPITVTLPDGKSVQAVAWKSTAYDVAKGISQGLADNAVISKGNGVLWDLDRPLEEDCELQLLKFDDPEAQAVFWHSSAHIMGEAMERIYSGCLCYGPPIENGFYYDMYLDPERGGVSGTDYPQIENLMKQITKEKQNFERLEMKKEDLLEMFKYNPFKIRILNEKVDTPTTTVYRCGPLIDLCRGPHVRHTGKVKAFKIVKNSSTYWEGKSDAETLQRIYGISFPDSKQLKEWEKFQEEAAKRDHRKLGREQELFFFHELSPGSCFFQPRGAHIYNTLINFIRKEYRKRGYQEVVSPNIFNAKLWQTSGHWAHYSDNMFSFDVEKDKFALKPMNCPGHCLIFDNRIRSWRELPLRLADFGVLHRNELSGALTGLTRVRRFQQDDAHIFCAPENIKDEIKSCLEFSKHVYNTFGFTFDLVLSTRPEKYLGELELWNEAEQALSDGLNSCGEPWKINPGDGAFYGPKIDITIMDALKRSHQCGTIQLDFQLPIRFNLSYIRMIIRDMENPLERHSPLELLDRYRFSRYTIQNIILPMVYPNANMNNGNRGLPIPPIFKLCCALRFFATGSYQRVCGDLVGLSQPSASRVVKEVAENLAMHLHRHITFPEVHRANVMAFYRIAQFPGVIGCVDGTHIEIRSPGGANPEVYRNRKGWMSLNVQVVAGPQCQILDIVIRWPGSTHDSRIFTNSAVCMRLSNGTLQGIILADSAYAQTRNVYTPLRNPRTPPEIRYNNAHKRTRNVVERTFGIWKGRFRCIHNCLNSDIRTATRIIAATAVLHNIAINQREAHNAGNIREIAVPNFPQVRDHQHVRGNVIRAAFIQRHFR